MRRAARVDANQAAIVKALRKAGCSVQSLSGVGKGFPDLLVGHVGTLFLLEVKNPMTQYGRKGLNDLQREWATEWGEHVAVVRTPYEALLAVGAA